jgi:hypothetical protein
MYASCGMRRDLRGLFGHILRAMRALGYHNAMQITRNRIAAAVLAFLLCGCSLYTEIHSGQELDNWAEDNELLARSGKIKWSEYYAQYLQKANNTPGADQSFVMERLGILETAALFYEQGRIDKPGFESVQNIAAKYQTIDNPAANNFARQALVQALEKKETVAGQPPAASAVR